MHGVRAISNDRVYLDQQRATRFRHRAEDPHSLCGDTLWDLASYHKVSVTKLAKWNSMAPRDPLVEGQQIVIWSKLEKTAVVDPRNFRIPIEGATTRRIRYSVRNGDSLARISQKFRVSINQLLRWNNKLSTDGILRPGQRITLYVDITRQSG